MEGQEGRENGGEERFTNQKKDYPVGKEVF